MSASSAQLLRQRATALRVLARQLEQVSLADVLRRCGTDTWIGPSQEHWSGELRRGLRLLRDAADATRAAARRLEHQADQLDARTPPDAGAVR